MEHYKNALGLKKLTMLDFANKNFQISLKFQRTNEHKFPWIKIFQNFHQNRKFFYFEIDKFLETFGKNLQERPDYVRPCKILPRIQE